MPGVNDLTGKFIADTYPRLVTKPDLNKEEYYNGLGTPITVINRDAIGTVKMFYPVGNLSDYFDITTGVGVNEWIGWALCDGRNGTPDLRGRFIAGYTYTISGDTSNNSQKNNSAFDTKGKAGAGKYTGDDTADPKIHIDNVPPHRHKYFDGFLNCPQGGGGGSFFSAELESHANSLGDNWSTPQQPGSFINQGVGAAENRYNAYHDRNTGNGTTNVSGQEGLKSTPDDFYPAYVTLVYVIRVS